MKNLLILANLENIETGEQWQDTFETWEDYHEATFCPIVNTIFITAFKVKGKNYNDKKENARQLAIDIQKNSIGGLSWAEYANIQAKLETIAKRYGLTKEFKENGII